MSLEVEVLADQEWAEVAADRFTETINGRERLCLATGSTTAPFYAAIAGKTGLDGLTIFLLDEFGGLPKDDPGRCAAMIRRDLLSIAQGSPRVHIPDVDTLDPGREADRYGDLIRDGGLDLAIVGLGRNGHIGMNEPGATAEMTTRRVELDSSTADNALTYGATIPPTWGITVGIAELLEAREVWLMVTGEHKTEILDHTLHSPIGPDVPATFLRAHANAYLFANESALGL